MPTRRSPLMKHCPILLALSSALAAVATLAAPPSEQRGLLADAGGMTLYVYQGDAPSVSRCNASCARAWPPLRAAAGDRAAGDFGVIRRDDGQAQWAHRGRPLYRFAGDAAPGQANGEHAGAAWSAVRSKAVASAMQSAPDYAN